MVVVQCPRICQKEAVRERLSDCVEAAVTLLEQLLDLKGLKEAIQVLVFVVLCWQKGIQGLVLPHHLHLLLQFEEQVDLIVKI